MKQVEFLLSILFFTVLIFSIQSGNSGTSGSLDTETVIELKSDFELNRINSALLNAVSNNDLKKLAFSRRLYNRHNDVFDFKIETGKITDQKSSGRCWLFAALNMMRPHVMKKYNLKHFEFSQNYLFFWDKLEKANMYLEAIIETREKPLDDRELSIIFKTPVADGGWWNYAVSLIEKYGVVPKEIMPETRNSQKTKMMNTVLYNLLKQNAFELREMAGAGHQEADLRTAKIEMLKVVYRILIFHLGIPPNEFTWRCESEEEKIIDGDYTPLTFYREVVGFNLKEYLSLFDHPVHRYNKYYKIRYCRNMPDISDMDFINLKVEELKKYALKSVLDNEPVWFAADAGYDMDREYGIMAVDIYDYESIFGIAYNISKAQRVASHSSLPNHAMTLMGVDTAKGQPVKWLVENSWGKDRGNKGYWTMYDNWFNEYVFTVIIHRKYLPDNILDLLETKPEILPAWDPMREAF